MKKGSRHSEATRTKMSAAKTGRKFGPRSADWRAKIGATNRGQKRELKFERTCPCGSLFKTGSHNAIFCSRKCSRASRGHGLIHAPEFQVFEKQCAICCRPDELVGDHDHATGAPRGILCRKCNLAVGNMEDDPSRFRAAAKYLEEHATNLRGRANV